MMNSKELTDKNYWIRYWASKTDLIRVVDKVLFQDILDTLFQNHKIESSLEIGGFPGYYSIYLKKKYNITPTLLDIIVDEKSMRELTRKNGLDIKEIKIIEADIANADIETKYDFVFSVGFIEHFENIKEIIEKHASFLSKEGILFIAIPNFVGINGLVQRLFDPEHLNKHNLKSMNLKLLYSLCKEIGFRNVTVKYYGNFGVWLENESHRSFAVKIFMYTLRRVGSIFFKIFPFRIRYFSPYIVLIAKDKVV